MVAYNGLWPNALQNTAVSTLTAITATGEKLACIGQFWHPDAVSGKSISRLGMRFGAVTKTGGSALIASLQDINLANTTTPGRPDETQDETVAIANSDAAFVSNGWLRTDPLSANRSISNGDPLAVVIEYDGAGRLGSDSVAVSTFTPLFVPNNLGCVRKTGGAWGQIASISPAIALECTDGTFGYLYPNACLPSAVTTRAFAVNSAPDERGTAFTPPVTMTVDGVLVVGQPLNLSGDFDVVIYEAGTAIHTQAVDASNTRVIAAPNFIVLNARVTLTAGLLYYVCIRPSTTTTYTLYEYVFNSAVLAEGYGFGAGAGIISRTDAGSWSAVTDTSIFGFQFRVCDIASGGGGASGFPLSRSLNGLRGSQCF
jgi:hypothetical protein